MPFLLVGCSPWGHKESDTTERLHFHFSLSCTGEGNGNPLQCSCLENPRDGGAWWAAIYGVTQSRTQLKRLSSSSKYTLHLAKAMVFPVVMYGCENWTIEKAERQRINAFELWCWRRLLRVPWTARTLARDGVSREVPCSALKGETVPDSLPATPKSPPTRRSIHGIFQARVLEWVAISFSRGSSQPRD